MALRIVSFEKDKMARRLPEEQHERDEWRKRSP